MAWASISLFAGFLEKENCLETLIVSFENVSPKGFFWLNMKNFELPFWRPILDIYRQPLLIITEKTELDHLLGFHWVCYKAVWKKVKVFSTLNPSAVEEPEFRSTFREDGNIFL